MYKYRNGKSGLVLMACMLVGFSLSRCSKMDDYKEKFVQGDLVYTAKPDSVKIYSGFDRVEVYYLLTSDPNIVSTMIYWGARADSILVPVTKTSGVDTIRYIIDHLEEGSHTFELVNMDQQGNKSVPIFATGASYGVKYQSYLINRPVEGVSLDTVLRPLVSWGSMDLSSGVFATEIRYLNNKGDSASLLLPISSTDTVLADIKNGSAFKYRTLYMPDTLCIDTFYSQYEVYSSKIEDQWVDLTANNVKNFGDPFNYDSWDGSRWGTLADWQTSASVKNAGGYGGYEVKNGASILAMEGGWGKAGITNGKIYQSVYLPYAGKWRFSAHINDMNNVGRKYLVAGKGTVIPDIDNVESQSLGFYSFLNDGGGSDPGVEFVIDKPQMVTLGFVGDLPDAGSFFECKAVDLQYYYQSN